MEEKIKKLIQLQNKKIDLLRELDLSKKLEKGEILYKKLQYAFGYYHLIDLKNGNILISGSHLRINSYCRLRNIDPKKII